MPRFMIAAALLLWCAIPTFAKDEKNADREIAGEYIAHGTGVDGKEYESKVVIEKKGETFLVTWKFADSDFKGVGIRDGQTLSVGWSNGGKPAIIIYKITDDKLEGRWADGTTDGKIFTENLTKAP